MRCLNLKQSDIHIMNNYDDVIVGKYILGPDLVFINLKMSREEKNKRLLKRHSGNEKVVEMMEVIFNHK